MADFKKFVGTAKKAGFGKKFGGDNKGFGGFKKFEDKDEDMENKTPGEEGGENPLSGIFGGEKKGEEKETEGEEKEEGKGETEGEEKDEHEMLEDLVDKFDELMPLIDKVKDYLKK